LAGYGDHEKLPHAESWLLWQLCPLAGAVVVVAGSDPPPPGDVAVVVVGSDPPAPCGGAAVALSPANVVVVSLDNAASVEAVLDVDRAR
jgi:hypothetical protein